MQHEERDCAGQSTDILNRNIEENIREKLNRIKKREIEEKSCLFGPQRTDIEIMMNNKDTRMYASQGEREKNV